MQPGSFPLLAARGKRSGLADVRMHSRGVLSSSVFGCRVLFCETYSLFGLERGCLLHQDEAVAQGAAS